METWRKNKNRGYRQLLVWRDAIELYGMTYRLVKAWPFELKKVAAQAIASSDSVHRNIAEGYCRRSIREYLQHLNIALGSLGETMSGFVAYHESGQIDGEAFGKLDAHVFRLENHLLKLVEALEKKRDDGDWTETLRVNEDSIPYLNIPTLEEDLQCFLRNLERPS